MMVSALSEVDHGGVAGARPEGRSEVPCEGAPSPELW